MKIVCFGDSLTSCGGENGRFSDILQERFPGHEFINRGVGSDTFVEALERLDADVLRARPDVPLRADLVDDLRQWLADRLEAVRRDARAGNDAIPVKLPADTPLFYVPTGLDRIINRDFAAAGIPKRDDRGRTVDVHAMRHTFGTHLSKGDVSPRTAQAAMRHSTLDLTMNTYTDPRLLDVAGALDVLPSLPLDDGPNTERAKATGTDAGALVPMLVPTTGNRGTHGATAGKVASNSSAHYSDASVATVDGSDRMSRDDKKRVTGFEPATFSLGS